MRGLSFESCQGLPSSRFGAFGVWFSVTSSAKIDERLLYPSLKHLVGLMEKKYGALGLLQLLLAHSGGTMHELFWS